MKSANNLPGIPIGTIVAHAGPLDKEWLKQQGWLYCDGSRLKKREYFSLFLNMGNNYGGDRDYFYLPDLRGRFARGVNETSKRDPDNAIRQASNAGGLSGNNPGSIQGFATALPGKAFTTTMAGKHAHSTPHAPLASNAYKIKGTAYGEWTEETTNTSENGKHDHVISSGGDKETVPKNAYIYFIIKFMDEDEG